MFGVHFFHPVGERRRSRIETEKEGEEGEEVQKSEKELDQEVQLRKEEE